MARRGQFDPCEMGLRFLSAWSLALQRLLTAVFWGAGGELRGARSGCAALLLQRSHQLKRTRRARVGPAVKLVTIWSVPMQAQATLERSTQYEAPPPSEPLTINTPIISMNTG